MESKMTNQDLLDEILNDEFGECDESSYELSSYYDPVNVLVAGTISITGK